MITAFAVFVAVFFNPLVIQGAAVCKDCDSCVGQKAVKNIRSHLQSAKDVLERLDTTKTKFNVGPWISFFQLADLYVGTNKTKKSVCLRNGLQLMHNFLIARWNENETKAERNKKKSLNLQKVKMVPNVLDASLGMLKVLSKYCSISKEVASLQKALNDARKKRKNTNEFFLAEIRAASDAIDKVENKFPKYPSCWDESDLLSVRGKP